MKLKTFLQFNEELKKKKRKKTVIKKITDQPYSWSPNFDKNSPAPESHYQINMKVLQLS